MRIEYMKDSSNGPLLRIFDFSNAEVNEFKDLIDKLIAEEVQEVPLHEHCLINPNDNAHLRFKLGQNQGIRNKGNEFECVLNKESYSNMVELISSFALHPVEFKGYYFLDETSDISLLISPDGEWQEQNEKSEISI
jgi:hypothetical protein